MPMLKALLLAATIITFAYPTLAQEHTHSAAPITLAQSNPSPTPAPAPASAMGDMHAPTSFTLRTGIAEGRMVYIGVGGEIDGKVNPMLLVHEGEMVQINLINGEGAEHDIVVEQYASTFRPGPGTRRQQRRCRSPPTSRANSSTSVRFRVIAKPAWRGASK